jgi:hypothetical protein
MATFKITYVDSRKEPEEIEADFHEDHDPWIDFKRNRQQVLRVRADTVRRVEMTPEPEDPFVGIA